MSTEQNDQWYHAGYRNGRDDGYARGRLDERTVWLDAMEKAGWSASEVIQLDQWLES